MGYKFSREREKKGGFHSLKWGEKNGSWLIAGGTNLQQESSEGKRGRHLAVKSCFVVTKGDSRFSSAILTRTHVFGARGRKKKTEQFHGGVPQRKKKVHEKAANHRP